jgi:hypothetical protein
MALRTLAELNDRAWFRFLKVFYIIAYILLFIIVLFIASDSGRHWHDKILPEKAIEAIRNPDFQGLENSRKIKVLSVVDSEFNSLPYDEKIKVIENLPNLDEYSTSVGYYTWNTGKAMLSAIISLGIFVLLMECIKRAFYYIAIGKVFPKE